MDGHTDDSFDIEDHSCSTDIESDSSFSLNKKMKLSESAVSSLEDSTACSDTGNINSEENLQPDGTAENSVEPWYLHPKYNRYWKHYNEVSAWYHNYFNWYTQITGSMNSHYANYYSVHGWYPTHGHYSQHYPPRRRPQGTSKGTHQNSHGLLDNLYNSGQSRGDFTNGASSKAVKQSRTGVVGKTSRGIHSGNELTDDAEDLEISEEMLAFFAQTRKHQKEWKKQQKEILDREAAHNRVDLSKVSQEVNTASSLAPSEQVGSRRTEEMKLLYGKGAPTIHGMETAMQLAFDRYCDLRQPKLWPNIPINLKF